LRAFFIIFKCIRNLFKIIRNKLLTGTTSAAIISLLFGNPTKRLRSQQQKTDYFLLQKMRGDLQIFNNIQSINVGMYCERIIPRF